MEKKYLNVNRLINLSKIGYTINEIVNLLDFDDSPLIPTSSESRESILLRQGYSESQIADILELDS